jgi:type IV pilus assembly protein PilB
MLVEAGVLDPNALRAALGEQRRWGRPLGKTLVDMRMIDEATMVGVLAVQLAVTAVDLDPLTIPKSVLDLVPYELAQQHTLVPFAQPMKFLDIAMADPTNIGIVDELQIRTQLNVRTFIAGPWMIERALDKYYRGAQVEVPIDRISRPAVAPPAGADAFGHVPPSRYDRLPARAPLAPANRDAEIDALQQRLLTVESLLERDQQVLRRLLGLLVDKGIATREEIVARLK